LTGGHISWQDATIKGPEGLPNDGGAIMALAQGRKLISKQFGEIKSVCQRAGKKLPISKKHDNFRGYCIGSGCRCGRLLAR
jgi:hypothetical protein